MTQKTILQHVAINYKDKEKADIFFTKVLDLKLQKSFSLTHELSKQIFDTFEQVDVFVYGDNFTIFEVFITQKIVKHAFEHVCIKVNDKKEFIEKCKNYGLEPYQINKDEKQLLFVKDFSGNLYEIK
jgi:catechol 2,3-dioxygenase-like lactoylglutathione lyase family enzyme